MAVHIRLTRRGAKKHPQYRIVVTDHHARRDGRFIENIGIYDPADSTRAFIVDHERLEYWPRNGAQLSDTVAELLKKQAAAQPKA